MVTRSSWSFVQIKIPCVIGSPMHNFSVPSTLKAWIDHVAIAGQTFQYTPSGAKGLLTGKAYLALSSGGVYSQGPFTAAEHLATYLTAILGFWAFTTSKSCVLRAWPSGPTKTRPPWRRRRNSSEC